MYVLVRGHCGCPMSGQMSSLRRKVVLLTLSLLVHVLPRWTEFFIRSTLKTLTVFIIYQAFIALLVLWAVG